MERDRLQKGSIGRIMRKEIGKGKIGKINNSKDRKERTDRKERIIRKGNKEI